jgi:hypothetical protein
MAEVQPFPDRAGKFQGERKQVNQKNKPQRINQTD